MAEMAAKCLTVLIWLTAALGLLPYGNLRRAGWRNLLFFCILGLQLTFSLQYLEYGLLLTFRDLTPMRLEGRELLAERILFLAAVFLVTRFLSWLLHRKLNFSRYLVGGALQTSLLVSSGITLAFSLIMNAYSARYHYPISINWSNAALFSSCLLMTAAAGLHPQPGGIQHLSADLPARLHESAAGRPAVCGAERLGKTGEISPGNSAAVL